MPTQIDPNAFRWGAAFQQGMARTDERKRQNAMLDLEQKQYGLNKRRVEAEEARLMASDEERARKLQAEQADKDMAQLYMRYGAGDKSVFPEIMRREGVGPQDLQGVDPDQFVQAMMQYRGIGIPPKKDSVVYGNINPGDFTPESLEAHRRSVTPQNPQGDFSLLKMKPFVPQVSPIFFAEGVGGFDRRTGGVVSPQATGGAGKLQTSDDPAIREQVAAAQETGRLNAQRQGIINTKLQNITNMDSLLDMAGPLVQIATGSTAGAGIDKVANFFGISPTGDEAIGALQPIAAALLANVPRMEGPQSDADRVQYERAAGDLANPTTPKSKKFAAIRTIKAINAKYRALNPGLNQKSIVRTGRDKSGRQVVQYSDGTIEYADQP
jgi:hypothetical protein